MKDQRKRKEPELRLSAVPLYGEVGAGKVVDFIPRNKTVTVALPSTIKDEEVGMLIVRGCSLEDEGIYDGDRLIFTKRFTKRDVMFKAICVVFIIATGELVAKKLLFGRDGHVTLRASGGGIKDLSYHADDIEIKGIVTDFQRSVRPGDKTIPF